MKRVFLVCSLSLLTACPSNENRSPDVSDAEFITDLGLLDVLPERSVLDASLDVQAADLAPSIESSTDVVQEASVPALRVLVFTRTAAFRHGSIPAAQRALTALATERNWLVEFTEEPTRIEDRALSRFDVVAFVLTSGDVLPAENEQALERFIAAGHGFVGVHSASDTEYDWPFYGRLVGARFLRHPPGTPRATLRIEDRGHPSTAHLDTTWIREDEWYSFQSNPAESSPLLHVLATVDEDSYNAAPEFRMGDHPVSWYLHVGGGRSWQTALGHTDASYQERAFLEHIAGGITWAAGVATPPMVLEEFNGTTASGAWDPHGTVTEFSYTVTRDALSMTDREGNNQHLSRRGISVDYRRPYAIDALFTIPSMSSNGARTDLNSFCLNFAVQGANGSTEDRQHLYTHAINLDLSSDRPGNGTMKWMGFIDGAFAQIPGGETRTSCCSFDREYRLRVEVHRTLAGVTRRGMITVTLAEGRRVHERFEVDYSRFPWQPDDRYPVRVGANTHGTDWRMRDLRVHYLP